MVQRQSESDTAAERVTYHNGFVRAAIEIEQLADGSALYVELGLWTAAAGSAESQPVYRDHVAHLTELWMLQVAAKCLPRARRTMYEKHQWGLCRPGAYVVQIMPLNFNHPGFDSCARLCRLNQGAPPRRRA